MILRCRHGRTHKRRSLRWKIDKSFELCLRRLARLIIFAHEPEHEGLKIGLIRHIVIANLSAVGGNEQICTCFEWQPIEKKKQSQC